LAAGRYVSGCPLARRHRAPIGPVMNVRNLLIPLLCLGAVAFACGPRSHSEASLVSVNLATPAAAPVVKIKKTPKKEQQVRIAPSFTVSVEHKSIRFALDVTHPTKKDV
jgi:hypothetical protein